MKPESSAGTQLALFRLNLELPPFCWPFTRTGRISMGKKSFASSQPAELKSMSSEDIKIRPWTEKERQALRDASERQASGSESELDLSEIPRLTEKQLSALVKLRDAKRKVAVSVRLDPQVLSWLRAKGDGHLTRINDILVNLMEAERRIGSRR